MSAMPRIIEGTWEECVAHAGELAGHRLKIIILDPPPSDTKEAQAAPIPEEAWAERFRDWAYNRRPLPHIDDSRDAIYEDFLK